ncbi:hypothetical protein [uncultured Algibacter sp.]|uniref:hypothetical protein n=1 Tax=uncultured Algibacter sp. TaxID=298659 RepID=UPI002614B9FB|nr:hypothetical protein [uncultured Algibacter sp.]
MIDLDDLDYLFDDLDETKPTKKQIAQMYEIYRDDFVNDYVEVDGRKITLKPQKSWVKGFEGMPETFVHLITREQTYGRPRVFDKDRANKMHWTKCVLAQRDSEKILYFEKKDKGYLKKHYWFKEKNFVVILKPVSKDLLLVTAFHVGKTKNKDFEWDYNTYNESLL